MAKACGMSSATVNRIWRAFGFQPHRMETFKLSADPLFIDKVRDIVGLEGVPGIVGGTPEGEENRGGSRGPDSGLESGSQTPTGDHHDDGGAAYHGRQRGRVYLADRAVRVEKPRLRSPDEGEVAIPAYEALRRPSGLGERKLELLLAGLSTRSYGKAIGQMAETAGVSKSSVSLQAAGAQVRHSERLNGLYFESVPEYPEFAWQEALVNTIAHRDYEVTSRETEVWFYDDRVEFSNPGDLIAPLTLDCLREGGPAHGTRNPMLVRVLADIGAMRVEGPRACDPARTLRYLFALWAKISQRLGRPLATTIQQLLRSNRQSAGQPTDPEEQSRGCLHSCTVLALLVGALAQYLITRMITKDQLRLEGIAKARMIRRTKDQLRLEGHRKALRTRTTYPPCPPQRSMRQHANPAKKNDPEESRMILMGNPRQPQNISPPE